MKKKFRIAMTFICLSILLIDNKEGRSSLCYQNVKMVKATSTFCEDDNNKKQLAVCTEAPITEENELPKYDVRDDVIRHIETIEPNGDYASSRAVYFTLPQSGSVYFVDSSGNTVNVYYNDAYMYSDINVAYSELKEIHGKGSVRLSAGTYYAKGYGISTVGKLIYIVEDSNLYEKENNNNFQEANFIQCNKEYRGNLTLASTGYGTIRGYYDNQYFDWTYDTDWYRVEIDHPGSVSVKYYCNGIGAEAQNQRASEERGDNGNVDLWEFNSSNKNVIEIYKEKDMGNIEKIGSVNGINSFEKHRVSDHYRLGKGNYYIKVTYQNYGSYSDGYSVLETNHGYANCDEYKICVDYTEESRDDFEHEVNDEISVANNIRINHDYKGNLSEKDIDYFTFSLASKGTVLPMLKVSDKADNVFKIIFLDGKGKPIDVEMVSTSDATCVGEEMDLDIGKYFVKIENGINSDPSIEYTLKIISTATDGYIEATTTPMELSTAMPKESEQPSVVLTKEPVQTASPIDIGTSVPEEILDSTQYPKQTDIPVNTIEPSRVPAKTTKPEEDTIAVSKEPIEPEESIETSKNPEQPSSSPNVIAIPTGQPTEIGNAGTIKLLRLYSDLDEDEVLRVGDKFNLYAEAEPDELNEDLEVMWYSENIKIADVNQKGEVTCIGEGSTTIFVKTTDGSKITCSYNITVDRALDKVNTLSKISYSQGKLTPNFSKNKTSYTLTLGKDMSSTIIRYKKTSSYSNVTIDGKQISKLKVKLKQGNTKIVRIMVTAENGKKKTYKIKVKRKK